MAPAFSVIFFTTATGAGYGMLAILGMLYFSGQPVDRTAAMAAIMIGFLLVSFGLLSSTFHLGKPWRAWRAFSQWRSSWLSREGVVSVLSFVPMALMMWLLIDPAELPPYTATIGISLTFLSWLTVYCTGMIYRSLPTIHQWHNKYTVLCYVLFSLMSGGVLLNAILMVTDNANMTITGITALLCIWGFLLKRRYWVFIDTTKHGETAETATGLGHIGKVRMFESPHSADNYLLKEMGFAIGRTHAEKLRKITLIFGFIVPFAFCMLSGAFPGSFVGGLYGVLALLSVGLGMVTERWLFFAQAKHVVTLYYGEDTA